MIALVESVTRWSCCLQHKRQTCMLSAQCVYTVIPKKMLGQVDSQCSFEEMWIYWSASLSDNLPHSNPLKEKIWRTSAQVRTRLIRGYFCSHHLFPLDTLYLSEATCTDGCYLHFLRPLFVWLWWHVSWRYLTPVTAGTVWEKGRGNCRLASQKPALCWE